MDGWLHSDSAKKKKKKHQSLPLSLCPSSASQQMGSCFSFSGSSVAAAASLARDHKSNSTPPAYVVSVNGDLRRYSPPKTASQVLDSETTTSSSFTSSITGPTSSSSATLFFLCNSDSLYFDQYIPALRPHDQLDPSQIYFLLPLSKLHYKLSASDMAALAARATLALQTATITTTTATNNPPPPPTTRSTRNHKHKRNPSRISPLLLVRQEHEDDHAQPPPPLLQHITNHTRNKHQTLLSSAPRPTVLQRLSSRRPKMAVRSGFMIRLTTISEGSVLLSNT